MAEISTRCRKAWRTYEHTPRYGTNYYGLRGRIGILSEAYSHDPFERRIKSTYAFVREILSLASEKRASILSVSERSDRNLAMGKLDSRADSRANDDASAAAADFARGARVLDGRHRGDASRAFAVRTRRTGRFKTIPMDSYTDVRSDAHRESAARVHHSRRRGFGDRVAP